MHCLRQYWSPGAAKSFHTPGDATTCGLFWAHYDRYIQVLIISMMNADSHGS